MVFFQPLLLILSILLRFLFFSPASSIYGMDRGAMSRSHALQILIYRSAILSVVPLKRYCTPFLFLPITC